MGRKLGHSWSPAIHHALGCGSYCLVELEPSRMEDFLTRSDIGGLNVTIPYKRDVMQFCDVIDDAAQAIGSVNTLARRADGKLCAWNTDAAGFCWMTKRADIDFAGKKIVILGSGGASLTAQAMSRKMGAREIVVVSRSGENNYGNLVRHADADIVVNTTPVGMYPNVGVSPVDLTAFPACKGVLDVIYNPRRTALLLQAEQLGIPNSDGLPMLVAQATAAEEHFFEKPIPDSENERLLAMLRRDTGNLVLIGMPGCGKSTVGELLGQLSGRRIIDLDAMIAEKAGMSIPDIFAAEGESGFRRREHEAVLTAASQRGCIIVCGGGVVVTEANRAPLRRSGRVYQIVRELSALSREGRPLSLNADLGQMYSVRKPLYEMFRDASVINDRSPQDTADDIWRDFCENTGA